MTFHYIYCFRLAKSISKCFCGKTFHSSKQLEHHAESEHSLTTFGIINPVMSSNTAAGGVDKASVITSSADPKLSLAMKEESVTGGLQRRGGDSSKAHSGLSIIHPITISGGVLLTPATARHLKNVNKGDILVAHKIATSTASSKQTVASLVGVSSPSLVTPPTTPHRSSSTNLSLASASSSSTRCTSSIVGAGILSATLTQRLEDQHQQALNAKVAQVLNAAKHAMAADAAKSVPAVSVATPTSQNTIVTLSQQC